MIEELLAYQTKDAELYVIEKELSKSPEKALAVEGKKDYQQADENIDKLELKAAELNAEFNKAVEEQNDLVKLEKELETEMKDVANVAQAEYLFNTINDVLNKLKALSQKIEKISANIKAIIQEFAVSKKQKQTAYQKYQENNEKYKALKDSKKEEIDKINAELEKLKKKVDPALMELYLAKREAKIFPVIREIEEDGKNILCGTCHMAINKLDMDRLGKGEIIACESCGRLMFKK